MLSCSGLQMLAKELILRLIQSLATAGLRFPICSVSSVSKRRQSSVVSIPKTSSNHQIPYETPQTQTQPTKLFNDKLSSLTAGTTSETTSPTLTRKNPQDFHRVVSNSSVFFFSLVGFQLSVWKFLLWTHFRL